MAAGCRFRSLERRFAGGRRGASPSHHTTAPAVLTMSDRAATFRRVLLESRVLHQPVGTCPAALHYRRRSVSSA